MSKLLKLKKWLTIAEAAERLSTILDEKVTEADVFQLAIDQHLTLSAYFNPLPDFETTRAVPLDSFDGNPLALADECRALLEQVEVIAWMLEEKEIQTEWVFGVWDLIHKRDTRSFLEQQYLRQIGSPWDHVVVLYGIAIRGGGGNDKECCILERRPDKSVFREIDQDGIVNHYTVASKLPKGTVLVVRPEALRDFEQRLADQEEQEEQQPVEDADDELAACFDPVPIERLQEMFPTRAPDQWKKWTERLTRYPTLKMAWVSRGRYNPYYAALFYIEQGADQPKTMRILAKNLPPRSKDEAFKFRALAGDDALD